MKQTYFTIGQAAKETGKSKATISRDIKKGKLSAEKLENGSYKIQVVELFRLYERKETGVTGSTNENETIGNPHETPSELIELRVKVKGLEEQLSREKEQCDKWERQAERVSNLLTDQREPQAPTTQNSGLLGGLKNILWGNGSK